MNISKRISIQSAVLCGALIWSSRALAQQQPPGPPPGPNMEQGDVIYFNQAVPAPEGAAGVRVEGIGPIVEQAVTGAMARVGPIIDQAVGNAMTQAFSYVSAIGPGPALPNIRMDEEDFAKQSRLTLLGRGTSPAEISAAAKFILSQPALTGQMIVLDGGQHLVWQTPDVVEVNE